MESLLENGCPISLVSDGSSWTILGRLVVAFFSFERKLVSETINNQLTLREFGPKRSARDARRWQ